MKPTSPLAGSGRRALEPVLGLLLAGVVVLFCIELARPGSVGLRAPLHRRQLLVLRDQLYPGLKSEQLHPVFDRAALPALSLERLDENTWVARTPPHLLGWDWALWIETAAGKVTALRIRTRGNPEVRPDAAPRDLSTARVGVADPLP